MGLEFFLSQDTALHCTALHCTDDKINKMRIRQTWRGRERGEKEEDGAGVKEKNRKKEEEDEEGEASKKVKELNGIILSG